MVPARESTRQQVESHVNSVTVKPSFRPTGRSTDEQEQGDVQIHPAREAVGVFHKRIYESKGTKNMLDQTKAKGVPYLLFY